MCMKMKLRPEAAWLSQAGHSHAAAVVPIVVLSSTHLPSSPSPGPAKQKKKTHKKPQNGPTQKIRKEEQSSNKEKSESPGSAAGRGLARPRGRLRSSCEVSVRSSVCALLSTCASCVGFVVGCLGR